MPIYRNTLYINSFNFKKNMKSILLLCTSLLLYLSVSAQGSDKDSQNNAEKPSKSFKERIYFGGNVGLNIGTRTLIQANPLVGYRITDKYSAGVGVNYSYFNVDPITQNTYGGSVFNRLIVLPNVFAQAEFELLYNTVSHPTCRRWRKATAWWQLLFNVYRSIRPYSRPEFYLWK